MTSGRTGPSDADMVREALAGDRESLAELLRRHWDTAVFLAARVLGSAELARDAAQEAAIAVLTDLERLRSPDRFGAWFCGIALNVARRWLRQLRAEVPGLPDQASGLPGLTPAKQWPPRFAGEVDAARMHWLTHPDLDATELRLAPDLAALVATRRWPR